MSMFKQFYIRIYMREIIIPVLSCPPPQILVTSLHTLVSLSISMRLRTEPGRRIYLYECLAVVQSWTRVVLGGFQKYECE